MDDKDETTTKRVSENSTDEGVRLVSRTEAEIAIESGEVVTRNGAAAQAGPSEARFRTDETTVSISFPLKSTDMDDSPVVVRPKLAARPATAYIGDSIDDDVIDITASNAGEDPGESTGSVPKLPHWTEPPTGEVPASFGVPENDLAGHDASMPRWRYEQASFGDNQVSFDDLTDVSGLGGETIADVTESPTQFTGMTNGQKAQNESSKAMSDDGSQEDETSAKPSSDETSTSSPSSGQQTFGAGAAEESQKTSKDGLRFRKPSFLQAAKERLLSKAFARRVGTAAAIVLVALVALAAGPAGFTTLAALVALVAAVEYFDALRRVGYRPAALLALLGVLGVVFGTYARGEAAILLTVTLTFGFTLMWYMSGVIKGNALANVAVTMLGLLWTGVLGAFAPLLLRMPDRHGMTFIIGAVLCTVMYDSFAYIGGNVIGKHPMAPDISPNKTWEGLAVGTVACVLTGAFLVSLMHPWGVGSGLLLGLVVAAVAPLGDLAESMIKRDLGLKDMGRLLPGHGGALDRVDALLFVLPATYYLVRILNLG